ncbi:MAG TPA: hypothetical protein VGM15_03100 [Burkholderiaceae bacterium]|jgi:hypothetical protein
MNAPSTDDLDDAAGLIAESGTVALITKAEIDQAIATAHKYPRSIKAFRDECLQMATLSESVAKECMYALPRDGKVIEGPSARFAEIVASAWGNCRAGARIVGDKGDVITAQGVFHDLERNVSITFEVDRRIVDKNGKRFKTDMIAVTANAAASIALRNAILKGVPKAFWSDMYKAARAVIMGDFRTLANRRDEALKAFVPYNVKPDQIYALLEIKGKEDITLEHMVTLHGLLTALQDGDTTPEQAFGRPPIMQPREIEPPQGGPSPVPSAAPAERPSADPLQAAGPTASPPGPAQPAPATPEPKPQRGPDGGFGFYGTAAAPAPATPPRTAESIATAAESRMAPAQPDDAWASSAAPAGNPITPPMMKSLLRAMEKHKKTDADLVAKFGYPSTKVTFQTINAVLNFVEGVAGGKP